MGSNKLIQDIDKKIRNWNERSQFKIKGVSNLSFSDLEMLKLYAEENIRRGDISHLMEPRGGIAGVLKAYGIVSN